MIDHTSPTTDTFGLFVSPKMVFCYNLTVRQVKGKGKGVPGGLGSQISRRSAREGGEVVSLTHRPPLPSEMFLVLIFTRG